MEEERNEVGRWSWDGGEERWSWDGGEERREMNEVRVRKRRRKERKTEGRSGEWRGYMKRHRTEVHVHPPLHTHTHTHTQAESHHESKVGAAATEGASRATMPIPTRIELSKNFSIISVEDIPLVANLEQAQPLLHYP